VLTSQKRTSRIVLLCSALTLAAFSLSVTKLRTSETTTPPPTALTGTGSARLNEAFGKLPLYFVENRGQTDARVAFYVQGSDKAVYFTEQGLTFILNNRQPALQPASFNPSAASDRWALKLDFVGARAGARPEGEAQTEAVISYFKGHPSKWKTGLKTYSRIVYRDLWPGIDLVYAGTVNRMKYSFVVRPGADPQQIKLAYRGASSVTVNSEGQLEVLTPAGSFNDERPVSFQEVDGQQVMVTTAYALDANGADVYGFAVGEYDRKRELVIDPAVLIYAGYIGSSSHGDVSASIAVDSAGNAYITGETDATEATFPDGDGFGALTGPDTTYNGGGGDAFVAKINAAGTALVYVGYIGGNGNDYGKSIAVDNAGNAYITGNTNSAEATFPDGDGFGVVTGPDLTINGQSDAFVAKINAAGTALIYAGYIGGSSGEGSNGIAVDSAGNAYITGFTGSNEASFPDGDGFGALPGPDKTYNGNGDAFVAKVNATGTALVYAGYIGGLITDHGYGIAVDNAGNAYIAGYTTSDETTFPDGDGFGALPGPDTTQNGNSDAFLMKVNAAGTALVYAGYIGGDLAEIGRAIAVDNAGNAYVTGMAISTQATFPDGDGFGALSGPDTTHNGNNDAFVVKVNAAGTAFVYATYIGGSDHDDSFGIAVDSIGNAYITGSASSNEASFPDGDGFGALTGPDTTHNGGVVDASVVKINAVGTALIYAGYIGGSGQDGGYGIAVDSRGNAYVTGFTGSTQASFPDGDGFGALPGPDKTFNGGNYDAFVAKISSRMVVNTTADTVAADGFCSLREAIQAANTNLAVNECPAGLAGFDTIEFNLGTGTPTINVLSALPTITEPVVIDGATGGATRIELNGANAGADVDGLQIAASNCTIEGLVINRFQGDGIEISGAGANRVLGNYIGTNSNGTAELGNLGVGVNINLAPNNIIGGTNAGEGNLISGNGGNLTNGGPFPGILINGASASGNRVINNYIGTDVTGTTAIGNWRFGVLIESAPSNYIGGATAAERNLISGNRAGAISLGGPNSSGNKISGNFIGTNANGTASLGVVDWGGISISFTSNTTVGGATVGERNIISGNFDGVSVHNAPGTKIIGNYIGTDVSGTVNLGNASTGVGISTSPNCIVGGPTVGERNVISGNGQDGIRIYISPGTSVVGNYIGTDVSGTVGMGNLRGISLEQSQNVTIGGVAASTSNIIAFNQTDGISLVFDDTAGNAILGNSIFSNGGLGIDIEPPTGVDANDLGDGDIGPNNRQNYPVLTQALPNNIQGTLNSTANTAFTIQFFANPACDGSGNGEGQSFIGQTTVMTDGSGNATINFTPAAALTIGAFITATATDPGGNTSEFSACRVVTTPPAPTLSINDVMVSEGNSGTVNAVFTVSLSNTSAQTVTVQYATANGTATAPSDYTATSGTLTFPANTPTLTQAITVQVKGDTLFESNETFFVNLNNPTNATLADGQGIGTILNDNDCPAVTFITKWGSYGTGNTQFSSPRDVAVDASGNVYVVDTIGQNIKKFDANGFFLLKWSTSSAGDTKPSYPLGVAVGATGNVYVVDYMNHSIKKFDANGNLLLKWGNQGTGNSQFNFPTKVAVDAVGNVYVADTNNHSIKKFDANGSPLLKWPTSSLGDVTTSYPQGVAVDVAGNVYVVDTWNHRIKKFDANGNLLLKWGSQGGGNEQLYFPTGVAVDAVGNIYVADTWNHSIKKFDANGNFLLRWGLFGPIDAFFRWPEDVVVDMAGNVYVADTANHRIQKFNVPPSPTANAGTDQTLTTAGGPIQVTLNGSGSSPFNLPLTYQWRKGATVLGSGATLNHNLPAGTHTITLVVTDQCGFPGYDTVVVKIGKNIFTGTNVTVPIDPVAITFTNVTAAGAVFVEAIEPSLAGASSNRPTKLNAPNITSALPNGYTLFDEFAYDVSTTATVSGPITACFNEPAATNSAVFASLRVLHNEGGTLVDRTILAPDSPAPDFNTKTVCARTNSLGLFVIARLLNNPPTLSNAATNPSSLGPANHNLVDVTVNYDTTAAWTPSACSLGVTSSEPDDGLGDGDLPNDIVIVNPHLVRLRAERANVGLGRFYTITITCTDNIAQSVSQSVTVTVPTITLSQTSQSFASAGGMGSFTVNSIGDWQAISNAPSFITVNAPAGGQGSGSQVVTYSVAANSGASTRNGTITINDQTFTVVQGAQFLDVPNTHPFYEFIGKLAARGVTLGCGNGNYCPDANVTREQMAIFIERALGVFTPPTPSGQTFQDVPPSLTGYPFIEDFVARGITQGCQAGPPRLYCPTANVTREQVAIFIERALGVFTPPPGPGTPTFADVPNSGATDFSYEFIEDLYRRGITQGCAAGPPRLYCPTAPVTRAQMAVFLVRAFNL
jgi:CSLREA domain-containing protein